MLKLGTVCIFSEDADILYEQSSFLSDRNYLVFSTSNIYKFIQYVRELQPDVLVFDSDAKALSDEQVMNYLRRYRFRKHKPVVMLGSKFDRCYQGVAHYRQKPYSSQEFLDIVESYCGGNKSHDVLLIDECAYKDDKIRETILSQSLSCFEVSDANAARSYLLKNKPRCICLNLPPQKRIQVEPEINHHKIFFVDNYKQVKNLAGLI